ncbi:putative Golgi transport complex 1 protein [Handroanthus impetiginosus]|uniref:Conserved oligomeric Golgi complex subunit 5 n=1 Tax=Handroanthus impetiginosus TaxID=429701 RepID=A0A2G9I7L0_9LAMI|nr:putative Golgi transport complex 1 protein [Handroanthus impetiginosus]
MASPAISRSPIQRSSTFKNTSTAAAATSPNTSTPTPISPAPAHLDTFSSDPIFSAFLSPEFNPTQFSSSALSSGSAASRIEKLQEGLRLLDAQLRHEVLSRHQDLLNQLSSIKASESSLGSLRSSISSLQSSLRRVRSELSDPHRVVSAQTLQLNNLHSTSLLLQSTLRTLRLIQKLRNLVESQPDASKWDLSKAAQLHCEILTLYNESNLSGIDVVDVELKWVIEIGSKIREEGMKVLEKGLESLNQPEVGLGLQVFYNMGELRGTVDKLVTKYKDTGTKSVSNALDMKAISGGGGYGGGGPGGVQRHGTPQIGGSAKAREALWQRISGCMDQLHSIVLAVWHLQRVLSKKRDPFTHVLLLDEVMQEGDPLLTDRVWDALVKSFASQMKSVFTASSFVKEIFTVGYPKLLTMIENLLERISRDTDVKGVPPALTTEGKEQMVAAIEIFQTAFLTLCLSRLSDLVNSAFPMSSRGSVPSKEHISRIISRIQEEVEAVQSDAHLTLRVLHEINKVLLLLAERAEYQISTGPEARQITGPATPAQLKNFMLCQHLQEVHARVTSIVSALPSVAADVLSPALSTIYGVAGDSVTSLFQAMLDRLESCILQIHEQNFGSLSMDAAMDNNASPYMEELQKSILHFRTEFLSRLLPSSGAISSGTESICTRLVRSMASRVLIFFIRHASLVRPLSESGKLRMARDMAELELTVAQNLFPVEQLGPPYRALRAFRPVIFLETSQLESSPLLQDLPPSVILHHLYSRGPDDLQSPLQRNKLTPLQYSLWMDSQGEDQIWKGIKATLDDYAAKVRARGNKEFSAVYPLMLKVGASLTGNES